MSPDPTIMKATRQLHPPQPVYTERTDQTEQITTETSPASSTNESNQLQNEIHGEAQQSSTTHRNTEEYRDCLEESRETNQLSTQYHFEDNLNRGRNFHGGHSLRLQPVRARRTFVRQIFGAVRNLMNFRLSTLLANLLRGTSNDATAGRETEVWIEVYILCYEKSYFGFYFIKYALVFFLKKIL